MASAQSLESDKFSNAEKKLGDNSRTCTLCKRYNLSRNSSTVHMWLTMDTRDRERQLKHVKNCILTPFLFGKRMNYSSKNITWLEHLRLIPATRSSWHSVTCLSDRFIEVAELAEEIVDIVFSCLVSEEFLHSSYHIHKELTDCYCVERALTIGKKSEFVSLMCHCFNGNHALDQKRIQMLSLTILHQALKHIYQIAKHGDCVTKFEDSVARKEPICTELRLKGNDQFMAGEYEAAVSFYSHAIELSSFDPLLYGNRAQSYLKLKKLREALSDAKRAVYLKPEWEKGHYRFAQAYFELGFPEKAMAVNSFAQKCCSSTLNLLCQAVAFKKEMTESAEKKKAPCCSQSEKQNTSSNQQQEQACSVLENTSKTRVGSKRNWNIANQAESPDPALASSVKKDTLRPTNFENEDNRSACSEKEDSDLDLSDNDSLPPLTFDSSDDLNEDEDDDGDDGESLWCIDLPPLASFNESDTESDSEHDDERCSLHDEFYCTCDQQVPPLHCVSDESGCSGSECVNCRRFGDDDDDNDDGEDDDCELDSENESDNEEDDRDESESIDNVDILSSLLISPLFNQEVNPLPLFLGLIREFLRAHPEMANEGTPPALPQVIESLPKRNITKEQVDVCLSCTICRCDYEEDETVFELPCSHLFHPQCVTTWLKMHATCPTCRDVLPH